MKSIYKQRLLIPKKVGKGLNNNKDINLYDKVVHHGLLLLQTYTYHHRVIYIEREKIDRLNM